MPPVAEVDATPGLFGPMPPDADVLVPLLVLEPPDGAVTPPVDAQALEAPHASAATSTSTTSDALMELPPCMSLGSDRPARALSATPGTWTGSLDAQVGTRRHDHLRGALSAALARGPAACRGGRGGPGRERVGGAGGCPGRADRARQDPCRARPHRRRLHGLDGDPRADGRGPRAAPALRPARARMRGPPRAAADRADPARRRRAGVRDARSGAARPARRLILVAGEALYDL